MKQKEPKFKAELSSYERKYRIINMKKGHVALKKNHFKILNMNNVLDEIQTIGWVDQQNEHITLKSFLATPPLAEM